MLTGVMTRVRIAVPEFAVILLTVWGGVPAKSCDCWVALRDATQDGSVILAKNSDRPPGEAQPLVSCPRNHYPGDTMVKCTYIEIPQSPETYEHIGSKIWVAKKLTSGVYSISNIYTIEADWDEAHPQLIQNAIDKGWATSANGFNFARAYGDYGRKDAPPWAMQIRRNATLACLQKEQPNGVSPQAMMRIARSHYEETIVEPRWGAAETFWATPCMHDSPHSPSRTAASMVAHLRGNMPPLLRQVYWAAFGNPCCGVYQPFYLHAVGIPDRFGLGTSDYSADSPWWSATRIKLACDLNYRQLNPKVREVFDATEKWEEEEQQQHEAAALTSFRVGNELAARQELRQLVDANAARIERECTVLNEVLPAILKDMGTEYLFVDYIKEWARNKKVPLPLP